ncbi:hypothetical protein H1R20_g46, partial [Candolleomyces eurysporus]
MASSTSSSAAPRVARPNSSIFGAIKNIVSAPLTWLAGTDHDDQKGKRRREQLVSEPSRAVSDDDDDHLARSSKRMRVSSPPQPTRSAYLDPPAAAFQPFPKRRTPAPIARSSSASARMLNPPRNGKPNVSRSTLSPIPLGRTMSIDPPMGQLRRETSMHDVVMDYAPVPLTRERSMPAVPLAGRPSFRMRSSLTPQPQREVSEPPPLSTLMSKPTFVRAPPAQPEPQPVPTLGNLAETVRSHSSLLFGSSIPLDPKDRRAGSVPVERALQELDIYKTPLVPTRMRSANPSSSAAAIPDMFKSRRTSRLVLMNDDRKTSSASHQSPKANEGKPYAGEGGMKKLLARRKQEEDIDIDEIPETAEAPKPELRPAVQDKTVPPPKSDWFAVASAGTPELPSTSSLRVGRIKQSRNHTARPTVSRTRLKFSAVYDEEGDDSMDGGEEGRRKEQAMIEEASKKLPTFQLPSSFSFSKPEATPLKNDLTNAKEPPISSLPFSFGKPLESNKSEFSKLESSISRKENSELVVEGSSGAPKPFRSLADAPPLGNPLDSKDPEVKVPEVSKIAASPAVPNFFANSTLGSKPLNLPATPPLSFGANASSSSGKEGAIGMPNFFGSSIVGSKPGDSEAPANDKDNPFWEGDKKEKASEPPKAPPQPPAAAPLFSLPSTSTPSTSSSVPFSFAGASVPSATSSGFSFGKPAGKPTENNNAPPAITVSTPSIGELRPAETAQAAPLLFSGFGTTTTQGKDKDAKAEAPKPINIFVATDTSKPVVNGAPPPVTTNGTSAFSFAAPSQTTTAEPPKPLFGTAPDKETSKSSFGSAPTIEAPKPLFGGGGGFSFSAPEKTAEPKPATSIGVSFGSSEKVADPKPATSTTPTPFAFGTTPATPPQTNGTTAGGFSFTPTATPVATPPIPFTFGGAGSNSTTTSNNAFPFGSTVVANPAERPVTPPKNNDQEFRMEESPTREVQANAKPTLSFAFGNTTTASSLFGAPAQGTASPVAAPPSPFTFGAPTANPFSPAKVTEEAKPFAFGTTPAATPTSVAAPFSFGPSKSTGGEVQRPSTGGGFSFSSSATPTTTAAPFSFGANPPPNPFATGPVSSAPSSPSTFNQASPFSFHAPLPASTSPFAFGSQPASPAGSTVGLPPATTGFGAPSPAFGQAPSSPFSAPALLTPSTSTGAPGPLFTIGAAPPQTAAGAGGARQIRKLPTRRTGAKR